MLFGARSVIIQRNHPNLVSSTPADYQIIICALNPFQNRNQIPSGLFHPSHFACWPYGQPTRLRLNYGIRKRSDRHKSLLVNVLTTTHCAKEMEVGLNTNIVLLKRGEMNVSQWLWGFARHLIMIWFISRNPNLCARFLPARKKTHLALISEMSTKWKFSKQSRELRMGWRNIELYQGLTRRTLSQNGWRKMR